jgi:CRISPR-associated protein Csx10
MRLELTATTLAPLALSVRHAVGNNLDTLTYIPGTALRGALAQAWLDFHGTPTALFTELFLSGKVRFGDLHHMGALPAPLSARICTKSPQDHLIVDHLLQSAAAKPIGEKCPCGSKRGRLHGYMRDAGEGFQENKLKTRRVAHTAIDGRLLRAANQQFHSSRVVSEDQSFIGFIVGSDGLEADVTELLKGTPELYLGRGRTRGQGRVSLEARVRDRSEITAEQIQTFHNAAWADFPDLKGQLMFSCTFSSRCLLLDDWLMSKPAPDASDIDSNLAAFRPHTSFHGMTTVSGWNAIAGLPKSECQAIAAGSAYLFTRPCEPTQVDFEQLAAALNRTLENGVGERIAEGFGDAAFCHPFHVEYAEIYDPKC